MNSSSNRYILIGLVASIAANLALIGFVAGRASETDFRPPPADPSMSIRHLFGELSAQRRQELEPHFRAYFNTVRPRFREMRNSQRDFRAAMTSNPLEHDALGEALRELTAHLCESQSRGHDSFVALIRALTLEERQQLVALPYRSAGRFKPGERRPPPRNGHRPSEHLNHPPRDDRS